MIGKINVTYSTINKAQVNSDIKLYLASSLKAKQLKNTSFESLGLSNLTYEILWDFIKEHLKKMRIEKLTKTRMLRETKYKKTVSFEGNVKKVQKNIELLAKLTVDFYFENPEIKILAANAFVNALEQKFNCKLVIGKYNNTRLDVIICFYNPQIGSFSSLKNSLDSCSTKRITKWILEYLKTNKHDFSEKYPKRYLSIKKLDIKKMQTRLLKLNYDFINTNKNLEKELDEIDSRLKLEADNARFLLDFYLKNEKKIEIVRESKDYFFGARFAQKLIDEKDCIDRYVDNS